MPTTTFANHTPQMPARAEEARMRKDEGVAAQAARGGRGPSDRKFNEFTATYFGDSVIASRERCCRTGELLLPHR